ncbi:LysR family transcriptional regulator [Cellulomonas iranensis]|uniref:LysR family transcriptional regulator n=1 Tax=Cellulomonas iranensis TaxID=76862 RepID=UPI003D7CA1C5
MLDLRRLVILREVAVRGTLAAAAQALSYSPSAVSQQLTQLEREAGVPLLRKVGRGVRLTPQALVLVEAAEALLDTVERTEAALAASLTEVRGTVRVAVFQSAALALMPAALRRAADEHPQVRVEMVQREPAQALHDTWARDFDLVVAEQYPAHAAPWLPGLDRRDLVTDPLRLALPPVGVTRERVRDLADAARVPWVMEPRGTASRHFAEEMCRAAGFEPDVRYETADLQAQIRLVESGNAVAILPGLVWRERTTTCRLVPLPGDPHRTVFTSRRDAAAGAPAVEAFRAVLEAVAAG